MPCSKFSQLQGLGPNARPGGREMPYIKETIAIAKERNEIRPRPQVTELPSGVKNGSARKRRNSASELRVSQDSDSPRVRTSRPALGPDACNRACLTFATSLESFWNDINGSGTDVKGLGVDMPRVGSRLLRRSAWGIPGTYLRVESSDMVPCYESDART